MTKPIFHVRMHKALKKNAIRLVEASQLLESMICYRITCKKDTFSFVSLNHTCETTRPATFRPGIFYSLRTFSASLPDIGFDEEKTKKEVEGR